MKKYRILINGKDFTLKGENKKYGFYTTRYIEGHSEDEATKKALNLIREELKDKVVKNPAENQPEMFVEEIVELESFEDALVPGTGFTWHPQK